MTRTFIDAGVLIAAATGRSPGVSDVAMAVLDDPDRGFVSSDFVRLEVLPKAIYHRRHDEVAFYERFFASVVAWADPLPVIAAAFHEASRFGLAGLDALHVAAATLLRAEELVTTEAPSRPIHRTTSVVLRSIRPDVSNERRS